MKRGDAVIYLADPHLYGPLRIVRSLPNGLLEARYGLELEHRDLFDPQELESLDRWDPSRVRRKI